MNHIRFLGGTLACIALAACFDGARNDGEKNPQVAGSASENLSVDQLAEMESKAAAGDGHAQALVESYHLRKKDLASYEAQLEKGASRRDPAAMQRLSSHLAMKGGKVNCDRAIILLNQARQLISGQQDTLRDVIDMDIKVLSGQVEGVPACAAGE